MFEGHDRGHFLKKSVYILSIFLRIHLVYTAAFEFSQFKKKLKIKKKRKKGNIINKRQIQVFFLNFILFSQYHLPLHSTEQLQTEKIQIEDHKNIQELSGQSLLSVMITAINYISLIADKHHGRVLSSLVNGVSLIFEGMRR